MPKQKPMKWPLPKIVHPVGTVCFQVRVPNEIHYLGAFYGAMFLLSKPYAWGDDPAHTALEVGKVWREIFDSLKPGGCVPDNNPPGLGFQEDFEMPLRVDCDCNVFVTCCDGTEKQILTADQVRALAGGQPGAGSPQPAPGGGCQSYLATIPAQGGWLVPTAVSTGDTLELSNFGGAWYGGSITWYCPDGSVFFAGNCTAIQNFSGSSQIPAAPIGRVIAKIGSTYYDILASGTFTVPGGHTNDPIVLLMNTDNPSTSSSQVTATVQVCNNQAAQWSHTFQFLTDTSGWNVFTGADNPAGLWNPGFGWENTDFTNVAGHPYYRGIIIRIIGLTPFHLTGMSVNFNLHRGVYNLTTADGLALSIFNGGSVTLISIPETALSDGNGQTQAWTGSETNVSEMYFTLISDNDPSSFTPFTGDTGGLSITVTGDGPEPIWP